MSKITALIFLLAFGYGCKDQPPRFADPRNDTTMVVQIALNTAFIDRTLPETGSLFRGHLFKDSIFVVTDSIPSRFFPAALDTLRFEFGTHQDFVNRLKRVHDSLKPNYLYVCCLEHTDSIYTISIQSRSVVRFGGGGSTMVEVVKRGDSMVFKHYMSGSIN